MALVAEAIRSLYGAYRLARLDVGGLAAFNTTVEGAWRSFFAAVIVLPFYVWELASSPELIQHGVDPSSFWSIQLIAYVISWVAFPVAMATLSEALGRADRFVSYLVVYNWAAVLQAMVFLPIELLEATQLLPPESLQVLSYAVFGAVLGYLWFIARTVLAVTPVVAMAVVALDFTLFILIHIIARTIY